ncbi:MAG: HAD family phosphatase [Bacilli bacterium]|nr:HAD family phosphatase [Bacilli bacterium]
MKNKISIIFVDIDWTIFDHSKNPSEFDFVSIEKLNELHESGTKIFIYTARPYHSVEQIHLFDYLKPDGMILSNGGLIIYKDEILYGSWFDTKVFEDFCNLALSLHVNVEGIRPYNAFLIAPEDDAVHSLFIDYPEDVPPVEDFHNQKVIGAALFAPKELDDIIRPTLPDKMFYFRYHDFGVDVAPLPHDKGEAIKFVLKKLLINKDEAMAIGDDFADISMFKQVKYSVAMENGREEVKKSASFITDTVSNHGVKKILDKLS